MKKSELKKLIRETIRKSQLQEIDTMVTCVHATYGECGKVDDCSKCEGMLIGPEGGTLEPCACGGSSSIVVVDKFSKKIISRK